MVTIQAKQKTGFWRCDVFHSFEPVEHDDGFFTAEQLAILRSEPMLSVTVSGDAEKAKAKKPSADGV